MTLTHLFQHIKYKNNKVKFIKPDSKEQVNYDLDSSSDESYWLEKMNIPFPDVAGDIVERLQKWEMDYKQMLAMKEDAS